MQCAAVFALLVVNWARVSAQDEPSCDHKIYCQGDLLHTIQMAEIFNDSKTFVDLKINNTIDETLENFEFLMNQTNQAPSREDLVNFVNENFESSNEFEDWSPPDYNPEPSFLAKIQDERVLKFTKELIAIWPTLGRKIKSEVQNDDRFSLIYVDNGFIIPGGRFKEFYYWDSYWITKGLLVSEMYDTVKGMLSNFISIVDRFGFIPNGGRVYYLNRSQPPLLTAMIANYLEATNDIDWLRDNIETIDKELRFWLDNRIIEIEKDGQKYSLAHYASESGSPRPESYFEDYTAAQYFDNEDDKKDLYRDLKSAAESGVDFSSRWFVDDQGGTNTNLTFIQTRRIIPVDLNSYLCQAFRQISEFYTILGDNDNSNYWSGLSATMQDAVSKVFYNDQDGIWYDWDSELSQHRAYFFPSNFAPLWTRCHAPEDADNLGRNAAGYFLNQGILDYAGGIPSSLDNNGEQWDYPNAWPPHNSIVIQGLLRSDNWIAKDVAARFAGRWIDANMIGFEETGQMFEKYDAEHPGKFGGGGEYVVQAGFGWTNGFVLELIKDYYATET